MKQMDIGELHGALKASWGIAEDLRADLARVTAERDAAVGMVAMCDVFRVGTVRIKRYFFDDAVVHVQKWRDGTVRIYAVPDLSTGQSVFYNGKEWGHGDENAKPYDTAAAAIEVARGLCGEEQG